MCFMEAAFKFLRSCYQIMARWHTTVCIQDHALKDFQVVTNSMLQEEKRQREEAELQAWKDTFSVEDSGEGAQTADQLQQRQSDFCAKLRQDKARCT
jgi:uncharacterized protein YmfQ (DUF2313 family)